MVDSLLCFVFVSKELDPLSRYLKMSWRGRPSQRLPPATPPCLARLSQAVRQSGRQTGVGRLRDILTWRPPWRNTSNRPFIALCDTAASNSF
jgi:hypothetical protein